MHGKLTDNTKIYEMLLSLSNISQTLTKSDLSALKNLLRKWNKGKRFTKGECGLAFNLYRKYFTGFPDRDRSDPIRRKLTKVESDKIKSKL